jgi:hypothetical protein
MKIDKLWIVLFVACGGAVLASLSRSKRQKETQAHKVQLNEWENEGGNLASPLTPIITGSALFR